MNAKLQPYPSNDLHPIVSLWNFSIWKLDFTGKINTISRYGYNFIIIATKYFMKLIEAIPMKSTKGGKIVEFIIY